MKSINIKMNKCSENIYFSSHLIPTTSTQERHSDSAR
jgi:hypothetical protein